MPHFIESTFPSCSGKNDIYVRKCIPDGEVRGVIQLVHGIAEHIKRYDRFAKYLAEHGFVVVGNDHIGHGLSVSSPDELGCVGSSSGWEMMVGDLHLLHEQTAAEYPGLPYFLFGHSMGSFLARTYIIRFRTGLSGCILSGTGNQSKALVTGGLMASKMEMLRHGADYHSNFLNDMAFGKYNASFTNTRTVSDWISRDEAEVDRYIDDPLCGYVPSAGLFHELMRGVQFITNPRNLPRMKDDLPVYFMSGDKDPVGENGQGVIRAYKSFLKANMTDVTMKLYHDGRHEMLNELNREEVFTDILAWLESKLNVRI